ncbi:Clp1/GlmU family protein [Caenispirillum salinarum]|uniref:Clp1/GlmU family protein n=1 Tax=Caenispirillum salinarum TaxID=859058 RepID=UPI0038508764
MIDVPAGWHDALAAVEAGAARLVVIGGPDAGKSTFCRWLSEETAARGYAPAFLDADPGQPDVGPPACLARRDGDRPAVLAFLGVVEPMSRRPVLLDHARALATAPAHPLIVNTCGFIRGPGRFLQRDTARAVGADLAVALEPEDTLAPLREALAPLPVLALPRSAHVRRRSQARRRAARAAAFAAHFEGAPVLEVPREGLTLEDCGAGTVEVDRLPPRLLCGVADAAGRDVALALFLEATEAAVRLLTPAARVERLRLGGVVVEAEAWRDAPVLPLGRAFS